MRIYILLTLLSATLTVAIGQIDDFEDGTTQLWQVGSQGTNPANVSTGGPDGDGDNYLQFSSNGGDRANSKLVIFNQAQWARDFIADNITKLEMDIINLGSTSLSMRLQFESGGARVISQAVGVSPQSGWQRVSFDIRPESLIGNNAETVLQNVTKLWLFHSPTGSFPPPEIVAQVGIDNFGVPIVSATNDLIQDAELLTISISEDILSASWDESIRGKVKQISILDASGKQIALSNILPNELIIQLDASFLVPGIHYVTLSGENILITKGILNK